MKLSETRAVVVTGRLVHGPPDCLVSEQSTRARWTQVSLSKENSKAVILYAASNEALCLAMAAWVVRRRPERLIPATHNEHIVLRPAIATFPWIILRKLCDGGCRNVVLL